jgi:hypothetical protein
MEVPALVVSAINVDPIFEFHGKVIDDESFEPPIPPLNTQLQQYSEVANRTPHSPEFDPPFLLNIISGCPNPYKSSINRL